jgi:hypothetical protein
MCCFVGGYVTHAALVPARDARELEILRDAARGAVLSGEASEWALGVVTPRSESGWPSMSERPRHVSPASPDA